MMAGQRRALHRADVRGAAEALPHDRASASRLTVEGTGLRPRIPSEQPAIDVLVVEDHQIVADCLVALLNSSEGIDVIGPAQTIHQAIALADERDPRVVLMDARLLDGSGVQAAACIHERHPETAIVFLSGHDGDELVLAALEAGACGYLTKDIAGADVLAAVRSAANGEMLFSSQRLLSLIGSQRERRARATRQAQLLDELTGREREVLALLAPGLDNREIAGRLGISYTTVRSHVQSLLEKIGAHSRLEAVLRAGEVGLLAPRTAARQW